MKLCLLLLFLSGSAIDSFCQNTIGIPDIINYSTGTYNAGTQNWDVVQDDNNYIYCANNEGLLRFDGISWKLYQLPNKSILRSIVIGKDKRIYAGGQNEIGYFSPDRNGRLAFTSLKNLLLPNDYSFSDVWDVVSVGNDIFFKTKDRIFQYNHKTIKIYKTDSEWRFLGLHNNKLIAENLKAGFLQFKNGKWVSFLRESQLPPDYLVTSIIPFGRDSSLITTLKSGLYILCSDKVSKFKFAATNSFGNDLILSAIPLTDDWFAIGTNLKGCYIVNKKGEIIQNLSRKEGVQNNTVVSMFLDKRNNLWLGLDNGIDFIGYGNTIKHIYPEKLNEGVGYTSLIYKKQLYIGTSNGLYQVPVSEINDQSFINKSFALVPNTVGSVWNLSVVNDNLLMGHHDGSFLIKNGTAFPINSQTGYWNFSPLSKDSSSLIIAGNYNGAGLLTFQNNTFTSSGNLPGINASLRSIAIDNNNTVWAGTSFKGVYKIQMAGGKISNYKLYTDKNGLPSLSRNRVFKVKNKIVVATQRGVYEYNETKDVFEKSTYFRNYFDEKDIRYLKEDANGNIWFIEGKNLGLLSFLDPKPQTIYFPELNGKLVSGFEYIYPYDRYNIFVGSEKGFFHINLFNYLQNNKAIPIKITLVKSIGLRDSLLFEGYYANKDGVLKQLNEVTPKMESSWNSFHFEYSSPSYGHQSNVEYSYLLKGYDKKWSAWLKKSEKDYTNLPPGTFTFQVKARNNLGNESTINSYSFTILPPWYKTNVAYTIYSLLFCALLYLLFLWQKKILLRQQQKHEAEQKRLQYLHQLELENSEKEIVKLKNEKLKVEIEGKNSELASVAMRLVHKGDILSKIKEELVRIRKASNAENVSDDFKKLIRALKEEDKMDEEWDQFAGHFDNVHRDFLKFIKDAYPNLTPNELKLCTYLFMNLSTKEIAQLMNISVRGVEISRYRLRKKLQISTETNLYEFLLDFSTSKLK
ncbi:ligand-binding sensor domain-containing protein [Segetibacter koreensis]|uniref:ligand-binding sensor domain-containing protein n=1 Tax=Segetibacter koreensis TaxID=398037 RepID=UPI00035EBD00|nr:triple tyrosine motif-containing protein [Segetibacter koreensis]